MKEDKRHQNPGAPLKYGEPRKQHSIRLTDTAWDWLKSKGGDHFVELLARETGQEWAKIGLEKGYVKISEV